jgi:DNA topoisomerase-1
VPAVCSPWPFASSVSANGPFTVRPQEYWSITAQLEGHEPPPFDAKLVKKDGEKLTIADEASAMAVVSAVSDSPFIVTKVSRKNGARNPLPPFITSKLQQDAIRKLRFSAKKTMLIAQQLYEGIDLGPGEPVGLITYMRTDSTRISAEAANEALELIRSDYGREYAMDQPRFFKNKKKVQDAHEAIRPTSVFHSRRRLRRSLNKDQKALYTLIWQRFVASQMQPALINQNSIAIDSDRYTFNASGSSIKFPGFMAIYKTVEQEAESNRKQQPLPKLNEGDVPHAETDYTQAAFHPAAATIFRSLAGQGTGRERHRPPSTYAAILSTIREKGYVELVGVTFIPANWVLSSTTCWCKIFRKSSGRIHGQNGRQSGPGGNSRTGYGLPC